MLKIAKLKLEHNQKLEIWIESNIGKWQDKTQATHNLQNNL